MTTKMQTRCDRDGTSLHNAMRIVDDAWTELQRSTFVQQRTGIAPTRLPDVSFAEAQRRSKVGQSLLGRLDALDSRSLPHELALTVRLVRFRAQTWSRESDWYWTVIDPRGIGYFGLFLPTAYCGGALLDSVHGQLASFSFQECGDLDRYLALIADYGRLIDQFTERTAGQMERGIRIPKAQVHQARALMVALKSSARVALSVAPQRVAALPAGHFSTELKNRIITDIAPAFDRAIDDLSGTYIQDAPEMVGIGQFPGGADLYAELAKLHTTLNLTPAEVHARGLERMMEIEMSMHGIRTEFGFEGESGEFVAHLNNDPDWRANTTEGVIAVFQRYIDRLKPYIAQSFAIEPKASYGVAPLPESLQGSMTFGYYDPPRAERGHGQYMFNAANLTKQALFNIAALTYHELMPGHHLHLATQQENQDLHPFRTHSFVNAYVEGWAEYAATFAGEIGMYELPQERYGRLVMDAFLTSRLVVDTGMNVLGWSLERARDYMRKHSRLSESDILTESVRYSCDIPGQALAYKLGDTQILTMRERMRNARGIRFDLKEFHSAVLGPGALPMSDLAWHIDYEIERLNDRDAKESLAHPGLS